MALIGRLFVVLVAFLAACLAATIVAMGSWLFLDFGAGGAALDETTLNILIGVSFIVMSGFALVPAMVALLITEAFSIRSALAYAVGGGLSGLACYLALIPFDTATMRFEGIVRHHLEIMTGAGIVAGAVYWMIAGRNAGAWRRGVGKAALPSAGPRPPSQG